ncbi:MAG: hypothetical protein E7461_08135 [Ruminococcaceae bacterium]|nr:hypothetical protein [Oscillospiraceae bacterium]
MKKLFALLLCAVIAFSLVGCDTEPDPPMPTDPPITHTYSSFTPAEKDLMTGYLGAVIPFAPNEHYTLEGYNTPDGYEEGFHFRTVGNTPEEFAAYQASLKGYTPVSSYTDEAGNTWYCYVKGGLIMDLSYYASEGNFILSIFVRINDGSTSIPTEPKPDENNHSYKDWSADDKALFNQYIGALIPFLPNNEYYIEGYNKEYDYENGLCFYTVGNTKAEFDAYLKKFSSYKAEGPYPDDAGDLWYSFTKDDLTVDIVYYTEDGESYVNVYIFSSLSKDPEVTEPSTQPGDTNENVITNDGKGLPTGTNGIYNVNFKDATLVKDVHDQGYYLDGCPTIGAPAVLVIPVGFSDGNKLTASHIDKLELAFGENGNEYYSVDNFYRIASYGQMDLDVTVLDTWYTPKKNSAYYEGLKDSEGYANGDQILLDEILQYLSTSMDLSKFDSDGNDVIDAVVMINNLEVGEDDFHWAYRYWNGYTDSDGYYYEYDGVSANDFVWASYYFLQDDGNDYDDASVFNTYTYIHEFGHVLGADDYYDTSDAENHPMDGHDVMDNMLGDHSAYTKFNLGWITSSRLVVTNGSITLTLSDFSKNGDTILLANNWDPSLGAYQEYYIVVYYTNNGLNGGGNGYFDRSGIVVYHVNASLIKDNYEGEIYYDVYNNNTDPSDKEYGTENNLLEFVTALDGDYIFGSGETLPVTYTDSGKSLNYTFTVMSLTADTATITFTKR